MPGILGVVGKIRGYLNQRLSSELLMKHREYNINFSRNRKVGAAIPALTGEPDLAYNQVQ